ncbi:MAG: leucine-rich repeat protein [Firmicutes bacterium]|nr:leucine-rich repeat protein [Bacillota bacterium]
MLTKIKIIFVLFILLFLVSACSENTSEYTITFDTLGGPTIEPIVARYLDPVTLPSPQRDGYVFDGWYNDVIYTIEIDIQAMLDMNFTLYAKWNPRSYQIHYDVNEGISIPMDTYEYLSHISAPSDPYKEGYDFGGWFSDEALTIPFIFGTMGASSITIYAKWIQMSYEIQFVNTGDTSIPSIVSESGLEITAPTAPTNEGFVFSGWYTDPNSIEQYDFTTMPSNDLILYADWATEGLEFTLINDDLEYEVYLMDDEDIETIQIPKNHEGKPVTKIADYGFGGCYSLTGIMIPSSVNTIGAYAFMGCEALVMFYISEFVTEIGEALFMNCTGLDEILVDPNNPNYKDIDGVLFSKSGDLLISYPSYRADTNYIMNNDVVTIGGYAFTRSLNLLTVTIGTEVTTIKTHAFYDCFEMTSIIIPNNVTTIELYAFRNCASLADVTIGTGLIGINAYVFNQCYALTSITIPSNITYIAYGAFYDCTNLNSIIIDKTSGQGLITGGLFMFTNTKSYLTIYVPDLETKNAYSTAYIWSSYASHIEVNTGQ